MRRLSFLSVLLIAVMVGTSTAGCVVWRDDPGPDRGDETMSPVGAAADDADEAAYDEAAGDEAEASADTEADDAGSSASLADARSSDDALGGGLQVAPNGQPASADGTAPQPPDAAGERVPDNAAQNPPDGERSGSGDFAWPWSFRSPTARPTALPTAIPTAVPTQVPTLVPTPEPTPTVPPTPTTDPFDLAGRPVHLEAPTIGVDAYMEQVGLTSEQAMDVPREWDNVAWYRRGYRPGELGNAVVAGHLDTSSGGPAVFWSLHELTPGDEIYVTYENGDRYTFVVEGSEYYLHNAQGPTIDRIFGESLTPDLNLITCDGAWDHGQATYSHRLVVFTTLAPDQTVSADGPAAID